jgi:hypothetical protein
MSGTLHSKAALASMGPKDLKDSFYLHIMRSTGKALKGYFTATVTESLPERIEELLRELDGPQDVRPIRQYTDNA